MRGYGPRAPRGYEVRTKRPGRVYPRDHVARRHRLALAHVDPGQHHPILCQRARHRAAVTAVLREAENLLERTFIAEDDSAVWQRQRGPRCRQGSAGPGCRQVQDGCGDHHRAHHRHVSTTKKKEGLPL
jgi:hypothetical protein